MALSAPQWLDAESLQKEVHADVNLKPIVEGLKNDPLAHPPYTLIGGRLYYKGRLPSVGRHPPTTTLPPALSIPATNDFERTAILATRMVEHGSTFVPQLLVQWQGRSPDEATWVDRADFVRQFPSYSLEDKASFQGEGIVTNSGQIAENQGPRIPQPIMVYTRRPRKDWKSVEG
ncbi:hypothetical protein POM88_051140 [Heracleum sosnowskyi]|uniref:Chromo domain-containing protein n=1 Tax=Heracleum sosnowskyi TaxID=360622 RepID=A0AAD8H173_9APIA|nr:hypothetical protein POM88_051140 [Heracleum sosnowskyi]